MFCFVIKHNLFIKFIRNSQSDYKGTIRASGMAGIEPIPSESEWLDPAFALAQLPDQILEKGLRKPFKFKKIS